MSIKTRIKQIEKIQTKKKQYICVVYHPATEPPEGGYKVNSRDGDPLTFETYAELLEFEARPDVELILVVVCYASEDPDQPEP
jgi:hypothetical protein